MTSATSALGLLNSIFDKCNLEYLNELSCIAGHKYPMFYPEFRQN